LRSRTFHTLCLLAALLATTGCDPTRRLQEGQYLLDHNQLEVQRGGPPSAELEPIIKQRPNKRVLWMRIYLWMHNLPDPEAVARRRERKEARIDARNEQRVGQGKEAKPYRRTRGEWFRDVVGEQPVVLDTLLMQRSSEQLRLYMQKEGWFRARVRDTVLVRSRFLQRRPSAVVRYEVTPGPVYRYRQLNFLVDDPLIELYVRNDLTNTLIRPGERFDSDQLDLERQRISDRLRELGYLYFSRDLIRYDADTAVGGHLVDIMLRLERPYAKERGLRGTPEGTVYSINEITISTARTFRNGRRVTPDTLQQENYTFLHEGRPPYKNQALLGAIFLRPEERFQQSQADRTYRRLTGLRVFDRVEITYDTTGTGRPGLANARIDLLPGKTQSVTTEGFGTNRGGFLGTSVSFGYRHRNLFRSMGLLQTQMVLGFEAQQSLTGQGATTEEQTTNVLGRDALFNTIDIGPEVSLRFPHFLIPFVGRERFARSASPRTAITTLYNFQQRPDFTRTLAKMSFGYEWNESRSRMFGIYPMEINVIKIPRKSNDFQRYLELANDPVLTDSYTDHLIAGMRGVMTSNSRERRRTVFFTRTMVEWAGNPLGVPMSVLGREAVDTAGNRFNTVAGVRYAEYLKVDQELRTRHIIHDKSSMAFRLGGGIGVPYGNLGVLPFESSFFVGGANGLRAWRARSLGPGSFSSPLLAFDRIGEIRLEANAEYRFRLIGFLEGALFTDVGNIWNIREDPRKPGSGFSAEFLSELAVGTGIGARLNFDFFLIRFDLGLQTKDPALPRGERWLFEPKDRYTQQWLEQYGTVLQYRPQVNFNLGIGYPF
jgi:hypothetical protein